MYPTKSLETSAVLVVMKTGLAMSSERILPSLFIPIILDINHCQFVLLKIYKKAEIDQILFEKFVSDKHQPGKCLYNFRKTVF